MHRVLFAALVVTTLCGQIHAQAFPNDNDGLLDVGEDPRFPADPGATTGTLELHFRGIEDLDGTRLLTNLNTLSLRSNRITSIEKSDFQGLANLQSLDLEKNDISSIAQGDFEGLTNLQSLSLTFNHITSIGQGAFAGLMNLQSLSLRWNHVTGIQQGDFEGLNRLQTLDLAGNDIGTIERGDFCGLANLQTLFVHDNHIRSIERGAFDNLTNLKNLVLSHNDISTIEQEHFNGLTNLQTLRLDSNSISSIAQGAFDGLTNLTFLNLRSNDIASIESGAFEGLINLERLRLGGNDLTELNLTSATFNNLIVGQVSVGAITSLVLDEAQLSQESFAAVVGATASIVDVSLVGLTFTDENPTDLSALLGIPTLDNVWVDRSLYHLYAAEFDAFAALPGNTVTVVPEPSGLALLCFFSLAGWLSRRAAKPQRYTNLRVAPTLVRDKPPHKC